MLDVRDKIRRGPPLKRTHENNREKGQVSLRFYVQLRPCLQTIP